MPHKAHLAIKNTQTIFTQELLRQFHSPVEHILLPERFTFPFQYQPHELSIMAANELRQELEQNPWGHPFWPQDGVEAIGKMFGVLVVQDALGVLGYLAAFSGKLAGGNHHKGFVPPVFDILEEDGFFRRGEEELNVINRQVEELERDPELARWITLLKRKSVEAKEVLETQKQALDAAKATRQKQRLAVIDLSPEELVHLDAKLAAEGKRDHFYWKDLKKHWNDELNAIRAEIAVRSEEINKLKELRKSKSGNLQQDIFDRYTFLNQSGAQKSLADIFQQNSALQPPAGAGECAAPKLLQYSFLHGLKPIAMAEFWWGASPVGEVRKHGLYYPACRGKCEPILAHMLEGIKMDVNPLFQGKSGQQDLDIVHEDEWLLVIHKPADLLSVPGKIEADSVYLQVKRKYPQASGPLIVHRLDMSTSGLMLIAKTDEVYKDLQSQFIKRTIKKRYVALLDGEVFAESGIIDLPLRVDLDDRPHQMVCFTYGKTARTEWEVIAREENKTRVHFYPITGRTHQLRVHAAHPLGLNTPIIGDDLYGTPANRLHLHAESLEFMHPVSKETIRLQVDAPF